MIVGSGAAAYGTVSSLVSFFAKVAGMDHKEAEAFGSGIGIIAGSFVSTVLVDPLSVAIMAKNHIEKVGPLNAHKHKP